MWDADQPEWDAAATWMEFTGYIRAEPSRPWKLVDEFPGSLHDYTLALRDGLERGYMGLGNASVAPVQYVLIEARVEQPDNIYVRCELVRLDGDEEMSLDVQEATGPPRDMFMWLMANVRAGALGV